MRGCDVRDTKGYSLAEMLVVVVLLGMILGVVYLLVGANSGATGAAQTMSVAAQDLSSPMETISRIVMQQTSMTNTTPYSLEAWTDQDMDGAREKHSFRAQPDGQLVWERWEYHPTSPATVLEHRLMVMSKRNANQVSATPLFRYFGEDGSEITNMEIAPSDAFTVRLSVVVDAGRSRTPADTRDITLRNKE